MYWMTRVGLAVFAGTVRSMLFWSGGLSFEDLLDPFMVLVLGWVLSPVLLAGLWTARSAFGLIGLVPIVTFGNAIAYGVANDTSSSTAALGWLILPAYEWAFLIVAIPLVWLVRRLV